MWDRQDIMIQHSTVTTTRTKFQQAKTISFVERIALICGVQCLKSTKRCTGLAPHAIGSAWHYTAQSAHSVNSVVLQGSTGLPNRKLRTDMLVTQNSMQCMYNMQIQYWAMSKDLSWTHRSAHNFVPPPLVCSKYVLCTMCNVQYKYKKALHTKCTINQCTYSWIFAAPSFCPCSVDCIFDVHISAHTICIIPFVC